MIEIYTIPNCSHCHEAREFLEANGMEFKEVDMSKGGNPKIMRMKKLFKKAGLEIYPIIIKDGDMFDGNMLSLLKED